MAIGRMSPGWSLGTATALAAFRSWLETGSKAVAVVWLKDWVRRVLSVSSLENQKRICL